MSNDTAMTAAGVAVSALLDEARQIAILHRTNSPAIVAAILIALALHDCGSIGVALEHAIGALGEERR